MQLSSIITLKQRFCCRASAGLSQRPGAEDVLEFAACDFWSYICYESGVGGETRLSLDLNVANKVLLCRFLHLVTRCQVEAKHRGDGASYWELLVQGCQTHFTELYSCIKK